MNVCLRRLEDPLFRMCGCGKQEEQCDSREHWPGHRPNQEDLGLLFYLDKGRQLGSKR